MEQEKFQHTTKYELKVMEISIYNLEYTKDGFDQTVTEICKGKQIEHGYFL